MKILFYILPLTLLLSCKPDKDNNNNNNNVDDRKENADQRDDNVQRNDPLAEPDAYIAYRVDGDRTIYLRDSDEDIDRLIVDLRPITDIEVALRDRNYWRDNKCRQMSARKCVAGDCVVGNCEQVVVGGWTVCRCRP